MWSKIGVTAIEVDRTFRNIVGLYCMDCYAYLCQSLPEYLLLGPCHWPRRQAHLHHFLLDPTNRGCDLP